MNLTDSRLFWKGFFRRDITRFDRVGKKKIAVEDFAQLLGLSRDTKYNASMEKVARVIEEYCTFPVVEKIRLFRLILVNFLIGNEDMHVKNFSLMTQGGKVTMTPAYDILNTTLVLSDPQEEIALPIGGKKRKLDRDILIEYFGHERLGLNRKTISSVLDGIEKALPIWWKLIEICFLPQDLKEGFNDLVRSRQRLLFS